ncbi:MAG: hypothetical protein HFI42_15350 [Lachnospiraceae bacterium]|nr:hypothetical protein [Lachnospiraceae bacterium]MCI9151822.1 hypothetical protein [Lachnospiraceae bacterium]
MITGCDRGPGGLRKMYERYALRTVCGAKEEEESWWDKRQKRMKKLLKEQTEQAIARHKAEQQCWLESSSASSLRLQEFLQNGESHSPEAMEPDTNVAVATYENLMALFTRDYEK